MKTTLNRLFTFFLIFSNLLSKAQTIKTIAGGGIGDGGRATKCLINPLCTVVDKAGNLYIADAENNRIRKVYKSTGLIETIAGIGVAGFSGDWGKATEAKLNSPSGLCLAKNGDIYIADTYNHRIRRINAKDGTIVTVAGNGIAGYSGDYSSAYLAELNTPISVKLDNYESLFIVDQMNNAIRKVLLYNGIISTAVGQIDTSVIGDGGDAKNASLISPSGICFDKFNNMYISDAGRNRIRKVDGKSGIISTFVGTGTQGYSGDGGLAINAEISIDAFTNIAGLCADKNGDIYISDVYNSCIRKVDVKSNIISSISTCKVLHDSSNTDSCLMFPIDVFVDDSNNIFIIENNKNVVVRINEFTGLVSTLVYNDIYNYLGDGQLATSSKLNGPKGICLDSDENIYFSDALNNRIRKIDKSSGIIQTIAGSGIMGYSGDNDSALYANLNHPRGICIDKNGDLLICDGGNSRIRKINLHNNIITTIIGSGIAGNSGDSGLAINAQINTPRGICIDSHNNIYFSDLQNNTIRKVNYSTGIITNFAGTSIAGFGSDSILATESRLNQPYGICADKYDNIYVADVLNYKIRKIEQNSGIIYTVAGKSGNVFYGDSISALNTSLNQPIAIAVDSSMNLFISDATINKIRYVRNSTGLIYTLAGTGYSGYNGDGDFASLSNIYNPFGLCIDRDNNILFCDYGNNRIRKIEFQFPLSTESISKDIGSIKIYPNPTNNFVNIDFNKYLLDVRTELLDMTGRVLRQDDYTNASSIRFNLEGINSGIYFVSIYSENSKSSYKVIKY